MKVDMSPRAIDNRLLRVSELRDLCLALAKSKKITERKEARIAEAKRMYRSM